MLLANAVSPNSMQDYNSYMSNHPNARANDYLWSLLNKLVLIDNDNGAHRAMGRFVAQYEGKNGNHYHKIGIAQRIQKESLEAEVKGFKMSLTVFPNKKCSHSMKFDGEHVLSDIPDGLPLANENCSLASCTCDVSLYPLRDKNGSLVWLD